ncbi:hypothetical protein DERP_010927 [Dermatophagoides pteronyssinus]|uniref:Uncharacterized protein n=1 Tax=Dermatophagoides pteronyssinus TaxID=6956 RepID=A0ABQ8JUU1_DERPT|nr:hypothetical protein DERP_010927 [Dermatophagoides pteronyssinus]
MIQIGIIGSQQNCRNAYTTDNNKKVEGTKTIDYYYRGSNSRYRLWLQISFFNNNNFLYK